MAVPFDQRPDLIWFDGKLIPTADCKISVLTHGLHYASAVFEGERAYGGEIFKSTAHSERLKHSAQDPRFRNSLLRLPRSMPQSAWCSRRTIRKTPMCGRSPGAAPKRSACRRKDNKIHLAIATWEWPSYFDPAQRLKGIRLDLAEYRRPDPKTAPCLAKAAGLYMICTISKHRAEQRGYRRRHDARLAGPRRRMHRRQYLLHQGRQDPYPDRRLLPLRHHPRDRDRAGAPAQHRGDRTPHHA